MAVDINISNYESFLLSYVDHELSEAELAALEVFLQQYPHIRAELDVLESAKAVPDEQLVFDNKAALYRKTTTEVVDYESLMLSYVDGELSAAETAQLKSWLGQHPEAQKELTLLQVVKLEPDTHVVFENKASLYRSAERKTGRIIPAYWWGATAAAVLAGLIVWLLPSGTQQTITKPIAGTVNQAPGKPVATPPAAPVVVPVAPVPSASPDIAAVTPDKPATVRKKAGVPSQRSSTTVAASAPAVNNTSQAPATAAVVPAKADVPVISTLPSPRNTSDDVMEKHLQNTSIAAAATKTTDNNPAAKETLIAANMPANKTIAAPIAVPEPAQIKGELIMSVSGSDSKILDKVTNVAKFFSRRKNK